MQGLLNLTYKFILTAGLCGMFAVISFGAGTDPVVKVTGSKISGRVIPAGGVSNEPKLALLILPSDRSVSSEAIGVGSMPIARSRTL
jgi:hypothetical protein